MISCPNCDAKYIMKSPQINSIGQNVHCSHCSQEWFQYNFYKRDKTEIDEKTNLKNLALEEYRISKDMVKKTEEINETTDVSYNVKSRIQESSDRLKETKQHSINGETEKLVSNNKIDYWTIIGFSTASLICLVCFALYAFNSYFQTSFPTAQKVLVNYKISVDQIIGSIANFYFQSSLNFL